MPIIDSDGHVIETPHTRYHLRRHERDFHPQIFERDTDDGAPVTSNQQSEYGLIGGKLITKSNVGSERTCPQRRAT